MKKTVTYAIVGALMILVVAVTIMLAKNDEQPATTSDTGELSCLNSEDLYTASDDSNPAAQIEGREVRLTCETFKTEVLGYEGIVMVDMYSPSCPHCQSMGPIVSEVAASAGESYKIAKIDVYKYSDVGSFYKVQSVPSFIFFKNGEEVDRLVGSQTKDKILEKLTSIN